MDTPIRTRPDVVCSAPRPRRLPGRLVHGVVALCALLAAFGLPAGAAHAGAFDVTEFSGAMTAGDGTRTDQAGAHADYTTTIQLATRLDAQGRVAATEALKDAEVSLPPGIIGDPSAVPQCPADLLAQRGSAKCSADTALGVVTLDLSFGQSQALRIPVTLYNIVPPRGTVARFGFNVLGAVTVLDASVGLDGQYHVQVTSGNASQGVSVSRIAVRFFGSAGQGSQRKAVMSMPTRCASDPLVTSLRARSWESPGTWVQRSFTEDSFGLPWTSVGCDRLPFEPALALAPSTSSPDAPTGLGVDLTVPQSDDPEGLATAHLRDVRVALPEGLTINPAAAAGLTACTDAQLGLGNANPSSCADSAKVGTITATTPLLDEELTGGIYVLTQASSDPASGEMFRAGLVLESAERGVRIKLGGKLFVDPATGRITGVFQDNPQMPVEHIRLTFKDGPRAPLVTPASCGPKTADASLVAWSGKDVTATPGFSVDCAPGLGGFAPTLTAGTTNSVSGAFTAFALSIAKPDGQAPINGLSMVLPTGLLAKLKGNLNTQVGSVKAFAGPGSAPFMLPGKVFLEGAYGDAPFSLRVVVPAKAGPFDLGEVVVRQKIYVDPIDAHVTVVSDPVPTIVAGVPVRLQRLEVSVDKPNFIINPTSCAPKTIAGTLSSAAGQSVPVTNRFQVSECANLALKPELALTLSGKGQTTDGKHPAISALLTQPVGQANLKKVTVKLPLTLALDPDNSVSDSLCSFAEGSKADPQCPASSVVGTAAAVTPILDQPLTGPVYFVKNERKDPKSGRSIRTLPKLVIPLKGNGVALTLTGTSAVVDDQLVTTFDNVPDAPVSSFKLDINGGKKGILVISGDKADICKGSQIAEREVDGQNNKTADTAVFIGTPSCPTKILSKKVGKRTVVLKVGGLGPGKVTVTGKGIKKTTKTITRSSVATITAKRTKGTPGKVTVTFDPSGPAKARKTSR